MVVSYRYATVRCVAILALAVAVPRAEAQYATEIAITGVTIPGSSGNAFSAFQAPVINSVGQVAFVGLFPGGSGVFSVTGHPVNTIPSSTDNSLLPSLRTQGATFPSAPLLNSIELSGNFAANGAGTLFTFNNQVVLNNPTGGNPNGQIGLLAQLNNNSLQGIFAAPQPSLVTPTTVALTGNAAPGTTTTYTNLANPPALNDLGFMAWVSSLATGGQALYLSNAPLNGGTPTVTLLAATGTSAAGATGNQYFTFTGPVSLISTGGSSFLAIQAGIFNTVSSTFSSAIFVGSSSTNLNIVAQTGTPSPVNSSFGGNYEYQNFVDPVSLGAANNGQVAYRANLLYTGASTSAVTTAAGLFVASNGGAPVTIGATSTLVGAPLPSGYSTTFPFGATYNGFGGVAQSLNGQVAFMATLAENNSVSGGAGGGGIFLSKNQSPTVTHIAVSGDIAPGTGGAAYASFFNDTNSAFSTIFNDTSVAINDHLGTNQSHEVAFQAYLAGAGVNGTNNQALFVANDQLVNLANPRVAIGQPNQTETVMLARTGQQITVNPGITKTIGNFTGFYTRTGNGANSFNDLGELVAAVTFVEGGSGIYVFTPDLHLSPFTVTGPAPTVNWGTANTRNPSWTFAYSPADQVYRVVIDPADVNLPPAGPGLPPTVTVNGPTTNQSIPGLQVSSNTGISHFVLQNGVTLTLGGGAITSGINVLTIQGPSDITTNGAGNNATLKLLGDVTSLAASGTVTNAGNFTAAITANFDLGNVPFPPAAPNFITPPPSTADVDRFRSFTVARGNFVGGYPIDLLLSGNITSPNETVTLFDGTTLTNDVHRGILKAGPGVLRLTGTNTFGPDTSIPPPDAPPLVSDPYVKTPFIQSIVVTGGLLSFDHDANLGLSPDPTAITPSNAITVTNPYRSRWITLDGGGIGLMTAATSTLANPTILDANRGIALGPVTGFGFGNIDVFGTNVLDYEGNISDNTDGITRGVGTLTKTGTGTLFLSGTASSYRGGTIVNQGTLLVSTDGGLGAPGAQVTVNAGGVLTYAGPGTVAQMTTTRSFTLNGGTMTVNAGRTVTLSNDSISGGFLGGPGTFATAVGGSTLFSNTATLQSATLTLNGADVLNMFSQSGQLNVAAGVGPVTFNHVTNQGSGAINLGAHSTVNSADFQSYGLLSLAPAPVSGQFTLMKNVGTSPMFFNGGSRTFIGTPPTAGPLNAGIDLGGQNLVIVGGLFVNNGFVADSTATPGSIIVDYGALYKGAGTSFVGIITQNGGRVQAGNSPGVASFGKFIFGPGGVNNYVFAIDDAAGTAGPKPDALGHVSGWGLVNAVRQTFGTTTSSGDFVWTATPTDRLTVALDTLVNPTTVGTDVAGQMAGFDPSQPYSWPAVKWAGTYSGPTDVAMLNADTSFDTSGFLNPVAGTFGWNLDPAGQTLSLTYSPSAVPEPGTLALVGLAAAVGWRWRRRIK
jgi:autotransporter-associated beta strand protein